MMEGMNCQAFWKFIKLLHDNDLLQHVEVVGSWCEYLYAQTTIEEVKQDVFEYVELFYNRKRMHSYLGYMSPVEYRLAHCA